nr:BBE domain-containing protein [Halobacterium noricense]
MVSIEGNWEGIENAPNLEWARETEQKLRGVAGEGAYAGFTGVEEQGWEDWSEQVYGSSYDRLAAIKNQYDSENVFQQNVNIDPDDA